MALVGDRRGGLPKGMLSPTSYRSTAAHVCWALLLIGLAHTSYPTILPANDFIGKRGEVSREPYAMGRLGEVLAQSTPDPLGAPLLPSVPGGAPMPLPPALRRQEPAVKTPEPVVNGANLVEGTGKFSGMILIPAGPFEMGSRDGEGRPDERPRHEVFVKDFYIA